MPTSDSSRGPPRVSSNTQGTEDPVYTGARDALPALVYLEEAEPSRPGADGVRFQAALLEVSG